MNIDKLDIDHSNECNGLAMFIVEIIWYLYYYEEKGENSGKIAKQKEVDKC